MYFKATTIDIFVSPSLAEDIDRIEIYQPILLFEVEKMYLICFMIYVLLTYDLSNILRVKITQNSNIKSKVKVMISFYERQAKSLFELSKL